MADDADFLSPQEHYDLLVSQLDPSTLAAYQQTRHARVETAFDGRHFILYRMGNGDPRELGRVLVDDLDIDDDGLSCRITCMRTQRELIVSYAPVQLWDYPVFVCLPLHAQVRFACSASNVAKKGSLAWPMVIRTRSRRGLREPGITYCETGPAFAREFDLPYAA
jgi:hypothetical protein